VLPGRRAVHVLHGTHFDMFTGHVPALRRLLRVYIDNAFNRESMGGQERRAQRQADLGLLQ
jgi:hypothetical protein